MHLEQQVHTFIKWIWGPTKSTTNSINELTSVNLADTPLKAGQDLVKDPFMFSTSAWHMQLARSSTLHLDHQVQTFLKWIWG